MTTEPNIWSKQPSLEVYLMVQTGELDYLPFCFRRSIINRYRKNLKRTVAQSVERPVAIGTQEVEGSNPSSAATAKKKVAQKIPRKFKRGSQGKNNYKTYNALRPLSRLTSGGKGRPSRRRKVQWKYQPITYHLKGNQYTGGQERF